MLNNKKDCFYIVEKFYSSEMLSRKEFKKLAGKAYFLKVSEHKITWTNKLEEASRFKNKKFIEGTILNLCYSLSDMLESIGYDLEGAAIFGIKEYSEEEI